MKKKIVGILVCTLLITTSAAASMSANEKQETASGKISEIDYDEDVEITGDNDWIDCMTACLAIGGIAGNCLYVIIGCALFPNPFNPCCYAIPVLCGIDLGLFFGCFSRCADASDSPSGEEIPCIPPFLLRLVSFLQKNNPRPALFLGLLFLYMCCLRHRDKIKQWFKDHGFPIPDNYDGADLLKLKQNNHVVSPVNADCDCSRLS